MRRLAWSLGALAGLFLFTLPARLPADVPMPGTQPEEFQDPANEFSPLTPSRACLQCHANFPDDVKYEPYDGWAGSMMGNAARDPVFLAALSIAEDDVPGGGDFCLRCHAPEAWLEGRSVPSDGSALEEQDDGVTCHFCHRASTVDPLGVDDNAPYIGNARYFLDKDAAMHGPYDDVTLAPHQTEADPFFSESRFCGQCHDISNPLVPWRAEDGSELGPEFPIERTYTEWLRSAFPGEGQTCQSCHMQGVDGVASNLNESPDREVYVHQLAGGNTWVPQALTYIHGDDLRREAYWAESVLAARAMLETAATLDVEEMPESVTAGEVLDLSIRVTNMSGHRLPTGYPEGRRMWLEVEVIDGSGATVLASGTYDTDEATRLEDDQLRTYEVQYGVAGQGVGFHFILNDYVSEDTRIPPRGFVPQDGDSGVLPVGRDYSDGDGGYAHWDVAPYTVRVPCGTVGPLRVHARLLQQSVSREYVEFLAENQQTALGEDRGARLLDAWNQTGKSTPVVMEELETTVDVAEGCQPGDDAGVDGGGGDADADGDGDSDGDADGDADVTSSGCCSVAPGVDSARQPLAGLGVLGVLLAAAVRRRRRE